MSNIQAFWKTVHEMEAAGMEHDTAAIIAEYAEDYVISLAVQAGDEANRIYDEAIRFCNVHGGDCLLARSWFNQAVADFS